MARRSKACKECSQNCMLMHQGQKSPSSVIPRFFKIMIGDDYSDVLYLPPKFFPRVQNAINQQNYLEDSTGKQWPVTVSSLGDNHLAIKEGWNKFAEDHHLEVGEFLVFTYIKNCHFLVQIFGISGCERLKFNRPRGRPRKVAREEEEMVVPDDPVFILNSNAGSSHREDKDVYDLSIFKMGMKESNPDKTRESSLRGEIVSDHSQKRKWTESAENDIEMVENDKDHIRDHVNDAPLGAFPFQCVENNNMSKGTPSILSNYPKNGRNNAVIGGQTVPTVKEQGNIGEVAFGLPLTSIGKEPNVGCSSIPLRALKDKNIVKTEPGMQSASVPYFAANPFPAKVKYQSYLEVPIILQSIQGDNKGGVWHIYLRDSVGRLWPVLQYSDTLTRATAFVDGWKQFCKKNNIQPGYVCEFKCEDSVKRIYGVTVLRKSVG